MKLIKKLIVVGIIIFIGLYIISKGVDIYKYGSCGIEYSSNRFGCLAQKAIKNNDQQYCEKLKGKYATWTSYNLEADCYSGLAYLNKDYTYCEKESGKYLEFMKERCYLNVARALKDSNVCNLSNNPDFCFFKYADIFSEPDVCDKVLGKNDPSLNYNYCVLYSKTPQLETNADKALPRLNGR